MKPAVFVTQDVCSQLWCRNSPKTCVSNRLPAVDGTFCDVNILVSARNSAAVLYSGTACTV